MFYYIEGNQMGLVVRKPVFANNLSLGGGANNKGADQQSHRRRPICAYVIHFMRGIISKLATSKISMF